jgi:hypothetical protein
MIQKNLKALLNSALLLIFLVGNALNAQDLNRTVKDSINIAPNRKDYFAAAAEVFGQNIGIWIFDRFIYQARWARISLTTIRNNLNNGFVWDEDCFQTNQFDHPYHGSLYFSSARSLGISYWRSIPYPFFGSLMWELFMENEYPSINDFITTPMGGIVLGETFFRLSNLLLYSGRENIFRSIGSFLIAPMNVLNRYLRGKKIHRQRFSKLNKKFNASFSAGLTYITFDNSLSAKLLLSYFHFEIRYGKYAGIKRNYKPFDYFESEFGTAFSPSNSIILVHSSGMLKGKKLNISSNSKSVLGIFQSFDFINNKIYKLAANNLGLGLLMRQKLKSHFIWDNTLIPSAIVLGGINSIYAYQVNRNYNLGPGINIKYVSNLRIDQRINFYLKYYYFLIFPLSGPDGQDHVDIFRIGLKARINDFSAIGFENIQYDRWSRYKYYPDITSSFHLIRVYYSYLLN